VLKDEGYIEQFDVIEDGRQGQIRLKLKYSMSGEKVIHELDRQSKPGRRVYRGVDDLPKVLNGMGIAVVSTSKGVMSDRKAREQNVGGELLCTVS
jgi:small subunit ribosomal protein S8